MKLLPIILLLLLVGCLLGGCNPNSPETLKNKYPYMKNPHRTIKRYVVDVKGVSKCPVCGTEITKEFWDNANTYKTKEEAQEQLEFWERQLLTAICPKCYVFFSITANKCKVINQEYEAADNYNGEDVYISDWGSDNKEN